MEEKEREKQKERRKERNSLQTKGVFVANTRKNHTSLHLISVKKNGWSEHISPFEKRRRYVWNGNCLQDKLSYMWTTLGVFQHPVLHHIVYPLKKNWLQLGISCRASYLSASRTAVSHSGCHQFFLITLSLELQMCLAHPQGATF